MAPGTRPTTTARRTSGGAGYTWRVVIPAGERLDLVLTEQVGHLQVADHPGSDTVLHGELPDLAAVYGLVLRLRDAGAPLLSLHVERRSSAPHPAKPSPGKRTGEGGVA